MVSDPHPQRPDLASERLNYAGSQLVEHEVPADPYVLFDRWLDDAFTAKRDGVLPEPTAMVVATCGEGRPSARTVLLKQVDEAGFVFYSNYASRKGSELAANPQTALLFGWYPLQRQVRVEGTTTQVPRSESEAYFATRPRGSQLGAWASPQSAQVESAAALTSSYEAFERQFAGGDIPCPPYWGGYRVSPDTIEFWQGQPSRMHDRLVYRFNGKCWTVLRLAP